MSTSQAVSSETTTPVSLTSRPISQVERIKTIGIVRGVALLGILLTNIPIFGRAFALENEPLLRPGSTDYNVYGVMTIFFEGKMRALFSMLFGAGILIFTTRKEEANPGSAADFLYRRLLWMVLFGVIHEYVLMWVGDILFDYAICALFLFPFRNLKPRQLLICSLICLSINALKRERQQLEFRSQYEQYQQAVAVEKAHQKLTAEQKKDKEAWEKVIKESKPDMNAVV
ncbi:hypothetical protein IC229_12660 [Spirosoma sp. BT702]|uniref:DUF418 domain-containing protein n=1 Tax=Spirosoma profusum TaxID=2771354 RepID=A0A926XVL6_9BACT|nr:hypothetical protein [Spirosoma profusum]MBD2701494.1 hypothetical protein [Spirosoma profusum]